jgi:hypothetical protein
VIAKAMVTKVAEKTIREPEEEPKLDSEINNKNLKRITNIFASEAEEGT